MADYAPSRVLVALPAHDEQELIGACLTSVLTALAVGRDREAVTGTTVAVALHRCTDQTERQVRRVLTGVADVSVVIWTEPAPLPVGIVRTRLIEQALTSAPAGPPGWIFSTDADTVVPPDWITGTLARAAEHHADLVLGLADLTDWEVDEATRTLYEQIIASGMGATGHRHAYAANLAIREAAFRRVGGFPDCPHGEEHGLADACRAAGLTVTSTLTPRVQTSARMPGRADQGLGALLARLAQGRLEPAEPLS